MVRRRRTRYAPSRTDRFIPMTTSPAFRSPELQVGFVGREGVTTGCRRGNRGNPAIRPRRELAAMLRARPSFTCLARRRDNPHLRPDNRLHARGRPNRDEIDARRPATPHFDDSSEPCAGARSDPRARRTRAQVRRGEDGAPRPPRHASSLAAVGDREPASRIAGRRSPSAPVRHARRQMNSKAPPSRRAVAGHRQGDCLGSVARSLAGRDRYMRGDTPAEENAAELRALRGADYSSAGNVASQRVARKWPSPAR